MSVDSRGGGASSCHRLNGKSGRAERRDAWIRALTRHSSSAAAEAEAAAADEDETKRLLKEYIQQQCSYAEDADGGGDAEKQKILRQLFLDRPRLRCEASADGEYIRTTVYELISVWATIDVQPPQYLQGMDSVAQRLFENIALPLSPLSAPTSVVVLYDAFATVMRHLLPFYDNRLDGIVYAVHFIKRVIVAENATFGQWLTATPNGHAFMLSLCVPTLTTMFQRSNMHDAVVVPLWDALMAAIEDNESGYAAANDASGDNSTAARCHFQYTLMYLVAAVVLRAYKEASVATSLLLQEATNARGDMSTLRAINACMASWKTAAVGNEMIAHAIVMRAAQHAVLVRNKNAADVAYFARTGAATAAAIRGAKKLHHLLLAQRE